MTRAKEQAGELAARLAAYGAEPIEAPTIEIVPPLRLGACRSSHLGDRDIQLDYFYQRQWVSRFMTRLLARGFDARCLAGRAALLHRAPHG